MHRTVITAAIAAAAVPALAGNVTVTFENSQAQGGFSFTPVWVALHNGGFDTYDGGQLAFDTGLTPLAEDGVTAPIQQGFADSAAGLAGGIDGVLADTTGAPVFSGGESNSIVLDAGDTSVNRYFSFASMVVPSNDLFIGNGNPFAHEVFDTNGNFTGPVEILIFGSDVNDNGTELNNALAGAAFSANGGEGIDESVVVTNFFDLDGADDYLLSFVNSTTVDGGVITQTFGSADLIGRITIVPTPGTLAALSLAGLATARRRR